MTQHLLKHLDAYADGKLDPEIVIEIDGLITRYLDEQLDPDTTAKMDAAIEANEALAKIVADNAEGKTWLEETCFPAMRDAEIEVPAKLQNYVQGLIADPDAWGKDPNEPAEPKVIPFEASQQTSRPSWWLLAASIVAVAFISGIVFVDMQSDQRQLVAEVDELTVAGERQQQRITELTDQVRDRQAALDIAKTSLANAQRALAEADQRTKSLEARQQDLEGQLAILNNDAVVAAERATRRQRQLAIDIEKLETQLAIASDAQQAAETELATAADNLASLEAERSDLQRRLAIAQQAASDSVAKASELESSLTGEIEALERQLADASAARATAEEELTDSRSIVAELEAEREQLSTKIAGLDQELRQLAETQATRQDEADTEIQRLTAEIDGVTTSRAEAVAELDAAQQDIAELQTRQGQLALQLASRDRTLDTTEQQLASVTERASWLNQIAGYHRGYAGSMKEVEFRADQIGPLLTWLSRSLDRAVTVPNLTDHDLRFIGGRLFFVNGMPVAQLAYHDRLGRLTGFCFMPNPSGKEKSPSQSRNGDDLYLVDWKDEAYQYVLIGFDRFDRLQPVADKLAETYRYET
ncbi:MAG: hypothetical protein AAF950_17490 [Pseudomonadota bacterium]